MPDVARIAVAEHYHRQGVLVARLDEYTMHFGAIFARKIDVLCGAQAPLSWVRVVVAFIRSVLPRVVQ